HRMAFLLPVVIGLIIIGRNVRASRGDISVARMALIVALIVLAGIDGLLISFEVGVYPFSVLPSLCALVIGQISVRRSYLLQSRGIDVASLYELLALLAMIPVVVAIAATAAGWRGWQQLVAVILLVPLFAAVQIAAILVREHLAAQSRRINREASLKVEQFSEFSLEVRSEKELSETLADVLAQTTELSDIRLLIGDGEGWLRDSARDSAETVAVTGVLYDWLTDQRAPLIASQLTLRRLGPVRDLVTTMLESASASVFVPLIERDHLVGAITANRTDHMTPSEEELEVLREVSRSTTRALNYIGLFKEAEERMEVAKELEVAAAVQRARSPGEVRQTHEIGNLIAHYMPAAQFGGDWWMAHELPDGRLLIIIGDVAGRGMPAALVSSSVVGACKTAQEMLGISCEVLSLLGLLNDAVLAVGEEEFPMSCFAAIIDLDSGIASFANAGHPFPYLVRRPDDGGLAELSALISRGTRLGTREPVLRAATIEVAEGDVLVFYSDALVDARNADNKRYGDRRLQHVLQRYVLGAGERACEVIIEDALAYCKDRPVEDDLTVVVLRLRRAQSIS
ncbi:MAG: PP2C family protein-serine/threonine phosphatase, partial [Myxococcota bacterium]